MKLLPIADFFGHFKETWHFKLHKTGVIVRIENGSVGFDGVNAAKKLVSRLSLAVQTLYR
jgi:hypothetical protein